jgi:hypothetical protein
MMSNHNPRRHQKNLSIVWLYVFLEEASERLYFTSELYDALTNAAFYLRLTQLFRYLAAAYWLRI